MNIKLCSNEKFWEYKWRLDFQQYGKPKYIKSYKEWYYEIVYNSCILYVNMEFVAKWVKKVVMGNSESYYLTIFGELYKFSNKNNDDKEMIAKNIKDISYSFVLTDDGECYVLNVEKLEKW